MAPLTGSLHPRGVTLLSVGQLAGVFVVVFTRALTRPRGMSEDSAAIVFPALDFERGPAMVRRCRRGCVSQTIDDVLRHVALHS